MTIILQSRHWQGCFDKFVTIWQIARPMGFFTIKNNIKSCVIVGFEPAISRFQIMNRSHYATSVGRYTASPFKPYQTCVKPLSLRIQPQRWVIKVAVGLIQPFIFAFQTRSNNNELTRFEPGWKLVDRKIGPTAEVGCVSANQRSFQPYAS